jgi:uncharacterized protein
VTPEVRPPASPAGLSEPLLAFMAATGLAAALYWTGRAVPFVGENLHGAIALVFLFTPRMAAGLSGRPFDYEQAGLRPWPVGLNLRVLVAAVLAVFPLFFLAFLAFYRGICALIASPTVGLAADWMASNCVRWRGWSPAAADLPPDFALLAVTQLVVIAVPEELFFRGYLLDRLEQRWPPARKLFGAPVGRALLVSSLLFAVGHVLVDLNPQRVAVFFPALVFGWMRARTGSIAAGAAFHALCNLYSELLHRWFFR